MSKHNLSDFTNEEPTVEATAEPEAKAEVEVEAKTEEEGETLELTELAEGEEEAEPGENGTGEAEEPERRKKPVQERFDKLVARAKDAERDAEYWRAKALEKQPEAEPESKETEGSKRPNPEDFEFGDADPAYDEAMIDWKARLIAEDIVEAKLKERDQRQEATQALHQLQTNYSQRLNEVKDELPDYDEVVTKAAQRGEWPCPPLVSIGIKASEVGPKIAHHLATNLDEAIELSEMSPADQLVALGRLEARFLYAPKSEVQPKVTQAPPPPRTLSRGSGGQFETSERALYQKMLKEFR